MHITYTHKRMYTCTVLQVTIKVLYGIEGAPCVPLHELAAGQGPVCLLHAVLLGVQRVVELPHIALGAGLFLCHMIRCCNEPRCGGHCTYNGSYTFQQSLSHQHCLESLVHSGSKLRQPARHTFSVLLFLQPKASHCPGKLSSQGPQPLSGRANTFGLVFLHFPRSGVSLSGSYDRRHHTCGG
jgi:hypothetical protein